tara:strand:+ start:328 stop:711 length:384 start_codon:yes stop_codon:yes gene_type:complete
MAGQLDSVFAKAAKQVLKDIGNSLETDIIYTRKINPTYNPSTGSFVTQDVTYNVKAILQFIDSKEESGFQENTARLLITPDLIGDSQPLLQDEISLTFSGSTRVAKITDIRTFKGGSDYLFRIDIIF